MNERSDSGRRDPACPSRRDFLGTAAVASVAFALPQRSSASVRRLAAPVRLGVITDLHHDIMHDGEARLDAFLEAMSKRPPDAIVQLGDFAYPIPENAAFIRRFNEAHPTSLHVIGNHDLDRGITKPQCVERFGMPGRHYATDIGGIRLLVLDGNDRGSPTDRGGYPSYVGPEQVAWLKAQLASGEGPVVVACHQPLAGAYAIDNAEEVQEILGDAADRVILAINGHSHVDQLVRVAGVTHLHVNSASYQWVGGDHRHASYAADVHEKHPWIACTCPYRDCLFARITIDPRDLEIRVEGVASEWVGASPAALGVDLDQTLTNGEEIAPRIRGRRITRVRP